MSRQIRKSRQQELELPTKLVEQSFSPPDVSSGNRNLRPRQQRQKKSDKEARKANNESQRKVLTSVKPSEYFFIFENRTENNNTQEKEYILLLNRIMCVKTSTLQGFAKEKFENF